MTRLTDQDCADIAITAAEGGIGYWSVIVTTYDPVSSDDFDHGKRPVYFVIEEEEPWNLDGPTPFVVNAAFIRQGVRRMVAAGHKFDMEDYDAETADLVIQYAAFGKVVFG